MDEMNYVIVNLLRKDMLKNKLNIRLRWIKIV